MILKLTKFVYLIRWKNVLFFLFLQALIFFFVKPENSFNFFLTSLVLTLIGMAGNIQNNILDYELDSLKPNFVSFNKVFYKKLWVILLLIAFLLNIWFSNNWKLLFILISIVLGLLSYNYAFKKQFLIGNIVISFAVAISVVLPFFSANSNPFFNKSIFILLFIMAFITTLTRELVKDMEDINYDKQFDYKTFPIVNLQGALKLYYFYVFSLFIILYYFRLHFIQYRFWILMMILALSFIFTSIFVKEKKYTQATKVLKFVMIIGILMLLYAYQNSLY